MKPVQAINRTMLLAIAPFAGILLWFLIQPVAIELPPMVQETDYAYPKLNTIRLEAELTAANLEAATTKTYVERYHQLYEQSAADASHMLQTVAASVPLPGQIYDYRITAKLGRAARHFSSDHIDIKLFVLSESKYTGYAMKVKLKSADAMQMVLGQDKLGASETTLSAVNRSGAIAGVNAGGFADDKNGRYPLGTTFLNGTYVTGFQPSHSDLTFIGLDQQGKLIGGIFHEQAELDRLNPKFGASFVPILLQNGRKTEIPKKWQTSPARAARTVVGNYKDDQLLFLVTDGKDGNGNAGATLAELQDKLLSLGVKDAYNLDGGGSSSLIFNGEIINRPADGKLRPLATHFLFFK